MPPIEKERTNLRFTLSSSHKFHGSSKFLLPEEERKRERLHRLAHAQREGSGSAAPFHNVDSAMWNSH